MTANSEAWKSLYCIMRLADQITKECGTLAETGKRRSKGGNDSKEWKESCECKIRAWQSSSSSSLSRQMLSRLG